MEIDTILYTIDKFLNNIAGKKPEIDLDLEWSKKPKRWMLINEVIQKNNYESYLEIGCDDNKCFDKVNCVDKVGVDPLKGGTVRKTSDDFFASNEKYFDFIFIDGLHEYEQVKKDIINSLEFINDDGIIMLHDCLPNTRAMQSVPRKERFWTGDVWKAIVEARTFPDIDTAVCLIDWGVGIIKKRPNSDLLKFDSSVNFSVLDFSEFAINYTTWLRTIEYDKIFNFIQSEVSG